MIKERFQAIMKSKLGCTLLALLAMFLWGSLFPIVKIGYDAFGVDANDVPSIFIFASLRLIICGIALLAMDAIKEKRVTIPKGKALKPVLAVAFFSYILHFALLYTSMSQLDSSKTAILKQTGALFVICFAFLFRKEDKFTINKLLGGILGFSSILVVNLNGLHFSMGIYEIMVILSSFSTSAGIVCSKNAYDHYPPLFVTGWSHLIGGIVLLLSGIIMGGSVSASGSSAYLLLFYICASSTIAYALWNALLKQHDLSRLNVIRFAEALFGYICAWILLGEDIFSFAYLFSFLLLLLSILIINHVIRLPGKIRKDTLAQ
ncbi:MAG: DMT family transporter [Clostridia bacterium]|nr:DMT family transporter [Clostridia bacterium]